MKKEILLIFIFLLFCNFISAVNSTNYQLNEYSISSGESSSSSSKYTFKSTLSDISGSLQGNDYDMSVGFYKRLGNSFPLLTSVIINSSSGQNLTSDNITAFIFGASDSEDNKIINITDWRKSDNGNLLINPGFEDDAATCTNSAPTGWFDGSESCWELNNFRIKTGSYSFGNDYNCDQTCSSQDSGYASVWPNTFLYQNVSVDSPSFVYGSAWVYVNGNSGSCGDCAEGTVCIIEDDARIHFYAYDSGENLLDEYKGPWGGQLGYNTGWRFFNLSWYPPSGTEKIKFQIDGGDGTNACRDPETGHGGNAGLYFDETKFYAMNSLAVLNMPFNTQIVSTETGAIRDYSSYENNGTMGGGDPDYLPSWTSDGKVGGAYEFDGVDDYIKINSSKSLKLNTSFSMCGWFKPYNSNDGYILQHDAFYSSDAGYRLAASKDRVRVAIEDNDGTDDWLDFNPVDDFEGWNHVAGVITDNKLYVYLNGEYADEIDRTASKEMSFSNQFFIGRGAYKAGVYFNGSIDEVQIYDRALSEEQIKAIYNSGMQEHSIKTIVGDETFFREIWLAAITPNDRYNDGATYLSNFLEIADSAPEAPSNISIDSVDGLNQTNSDLNCSLILDDSDSENLNVSVRWLVNGSIHLEINYTDNYENGTLFSSVLNSGNTTKDENWSCSVQLYDGNSYSDWGNSSNLTILNTLPNVTLDYPSNNAIINDRTPFFNWTSDDADAKDLDNLYFEINLTCYNSAGGTCTIDNRNEFSSNENYTIQRYLEYLSDNNYYYNWTVRASDDSGATFGDWAEPRKLSIQSIVDIVLLNDTTDFGTLNINQSEDTSDDSPLPLLMENKGNCFLNITINSTELWQNIEGSSKYYKYKIDNNTQQGELKSFVAPRSVIDWQSVPIDPDTNVSIVNFNFSNLTDSAEIDLYIKPPSDEIPGNKSANITFIASLSE